MSNTTANQEKQFNTAPLLQQFNRTTPAEMASEIDQAITALTNYQLEHSPMAPLKMANILDTLRNTRNALLSGAGIVDL